MVDEFKILIFSLGQQHFAADIKEVERILNYEVPTKLPDSEGFLEGVINYEDGILPVISLAKRLGVEVSDSSEEQGSIIVTRRGEETLGIIVEAVNEVKAVNTEELDETPDISSDVSKRYIRGLIRDKKNNTIVLLLNLNELLSKEEKDKMEI